MLRICIVFWICYTVVEISSARMLSYTVKEELPAGHPVGSVITDADLAGRYAAAGGIPSILRFSLLKSSPYFTINSTGSNIRTVQRLDRELICRDKPNEPCVITIDVVVNPRTPPHFQMIKVRITIVDVNDNSPMFPRPTKDILIREDAPINNTIFLPTAEDRDSDTFGVAEYELGAHTQAFKIRSVATGYGATELLLVLDKKLDREIQGSYTLKLVARDSGIPSRSGMMLLNVTVVDVNDNAPYFQQSIYHVRVPESTKPGIMLTRVLATDRDAGKNGRVSYSISPRTSSKIRRIFQINEISGELFLRQHLNYEDERSFLIPIMAWDSGGNIRKRSQAVVNISIADENDNHPVITVTTVGSKKAQVTEHSLNGTFVAHVRVEDKDSGNNGLVTCVILSSPHFSLQKSYQDEYNLVVNTGLDREQNTELNVTILCSDQGSPQRSSRHHLTVTIVDLNDQKPYFDRFVYYTAPILENNAKGIPITQVKAHDKDADINAEIQYKLGSEFDATYFSVNPITGLITARTRLDREDRKDYTFSVLAVDKGRNPLTATAAVYVRLADVNDNPPVFNKTHYEMAVPENMPKYSFVGKVTATDKDEGANRDLWYRMVNASSGPFIVAHDTGIISTRVPLDRERNFGGRYQITVIATDYGSPALSSQVTVTIDVIDENDNKPLVTGIELPNKKILPAENMTVNCSYATPYNVTISKLKVFDPDYKENGRLGYFIKTGNRYRMFMIVKTTGEIKMARRVDLSMTGSYTLEIGVHDNGQPPHTVTVSVVVRVTRNAYIPVEALVGRKPIEPTAAERTYDVNLIVVIVLSSTSGVLSIILIIAIIRIKRQTKENHSYNCRTEAQKLFSHSGRSSNESRPSCGSSWGALSTTDRSSVFSRVSACSEGDPAEPLAAQTFLTTFSSTHKNVPTALQSMDKSNLEKTSTDISKPSKAAVTAAAAANLQKSLLDKTKEPDSDSGNCEDVCSVHNSTPVLTEAPSNSVNPSPGGAHQSFHYKFLSTAGLGDGTDSKVPSSISSGNNSINTNSSQHGSPAINQNSSTNHKQRDGAALSAHCSAGGATTKHSPPPPQESSSDNYPAQNTSDMSDQTINADRLCAHIDDLFFSEIV